MIDIIEFIFRNNCIKYFLTFHDILTFMNGNFKYQIKINKGKINHFRLTITGRFSFELLSLIASF